MSKLGQLRRWTRERGLAWTAMYCVRAAVVRTLRRVESALVRVEQARFITGDHTVTSSRHTVEENRRIWNDYDWSERGEEWTRSAEEYRGLDPERWKARLVDGM